MKSEHELWSRYAIAYDMIVEHSQEYWTLINYIVRLVTGRKRCLDLGAGTGNGTIRLLEADPEREVSAVDNNSSMLDLIRRKLACVKSSCRFGTRLQIIAADALDLCGLYGADFDSAVLINVFHTLEDRERCLQQVYRVLQEDGIIILSTAHDKTDVEKLLARLEEELRNAGCLSHLQKEWDLVCQLNRRWKALFTRDSIENILQMLANNRFHVMADYTSMYAESVIVIEGHKTRKDWVKYWSP